ncbi:hypothetical protein LZ554_003976 [Drepanopeziza brunnea f. sp. 'monogermtubi']|nr:hypothetical protein LZ554_003976 [Drepanopeziza brunnea f. sp. 'monogermtubi']
MLTVPLLINGRDVTTSKTIDVTSPTGQVIHRAAAAGVADAIAAVEAAQAAFPAWAATTPDAKRKIFYKAADLLEARLEEAGKCEEAETGALPSFAGGFDVTTAIAGLRSVAGEIGSVLGSIPSTNNPKREALVLKEPFGVILGMAPWNAPYILGLRSFSFAIAAGNTAICKAPEVAPQSVNILGQVFRDAGLPDGVLNIIQTHPSDAAAVTRAIIEHPAVRKINFTGSTAVGRIVAELAGKNLKPVLMELGGKAPAIVLPDADLELAATGCAVGAFLHSGQVCMATERIIVVKGITDKFAEVLKGTIEAIFPSKGDALVLVSEAGVQKNKALVADAQRKGGEVIFGDINAAEAAPARMRPVVVKGVTKEMDIYYTESFGPTVSLIEVEDEEAAIQLANDTEYGLSSSVFTRDLLAGLRLAKRIESGAVHINAMSVHDEPGLPHGGVKASGWGRFGANGINEWYKTKTITYMTS